MTLRPALKNWCFHSFLGFRRKLLGLGDGTKRYGWCNEFTIFHFPFSFRDAVIKRPLEKDARKILINRNFFQKFLKNDAANYKRSDEKPNSKDEPRPRKNLILLSFFLFGFRVCVIIRVRVLRVCVIGVHMFENGAKSISHGVKSTETSKQTKQPAA